MKLFCYQSIDEAVVVSVEFVRAHMDHRRSGRVQALTQRLDEFSLVCRHRCGASECSAEIGEERGVPAVAVDRDGDQVDGVLRAPGAQCNESSEMRCATVSTTIHT